MRDGYHHGNLKHDLIETAIGVISENGFEALSLRGVSALCGVSHNAAYRHFENKVQLISACRAYVTERLTEYLNETIKSLDLSSEESLRRLSAAYISFYAQYPTYYSALYRNTDAKLVFSSEETDANYPPLELFRKAYSAFGAAKGWTEEEIMTHLIRRWSLLHGLTALVISPNVKWDGDWQRCLNNIIE